MLYCTISKKRRKNDCDRFICMYTHVINLVLNCTNGHKRNRMLSRCIYRLLDDNAFLFSKREKKNEETTSHV